MSEAGEVALTSVPISKKGIHRAITRPHTTESTYLQIGLNILEARLVPTIFVQVLAEMSD